MGEITLDKLLADAREALEIGTDIGEKIILVGTSTGASLATWLTYHNPDKIHALIFLSPNFALKRQTSKLLTLPFGKIFLKLLVGDYYKIKSTNERQEQYWTTTYPSIALMPLMQLLKKVEQLPLKNITTPLLCFYSDKDQVVSPSAIKKSFNRFGSPCNKLVEIESEEKVHSHILAGDILSPGTTAQVVKIIDEFLKTV